MATPSPVPPPPIPPPPGPAQRLVAKSGLVVYEGGRSLFDEPVLVFLSRPAPRWPDIDIYDHIDRPIGRTRKLVKPGLFSSDGASGIYDVTGPIVMVVDPKPKFFRFTYEVSGVANANFTMPSIMSSEIAIEANNEPFGFIKGQGLGGTTGRHVSILDAEKRPVGQIRTFNESITLLGRSRSLVLSLDPGLRGELRRLIIAAPLVLESIRRRRQSGT